MPHATSQVILAVSYTLIYNYKFVIIIYNEMNASYDINHQPPNKPLCMPPSHQPVSIHHNKATSTRFCICACHTPYPTFSLSLSTITYPHPTLLFSSSSPPLMPPLKLQIPLPFYPKLQGEAIFGVLEHTSTLWGFKFQVRVDFFSLEIRGCWVFGSYDG